MNTDNDKELVYRCQVEDNEEAFGELYSRYFEEVKSILMAKTGVCEQDACDIVQKAFIKAMRHIKSFKGTCSFKTWIFKIAYNTFLDNLRSNRNHYSLESLTVSEFGEKQLQETVTYDTPSSELSEQDRVAELAASIQGAREKLSKNQKEIFDMIFVDGLSYKEASDKMDCPIGTVMSRVHFTRKRLQKLLDKEKRQVLT